MSVARDVERGGIAQHPDVVRRKAEPWSVHVHDFLRHLERKGFEGAPRSLGIVDGREAVSWVDGWASGIPFDGPLLEPSGVMSVGRLLRRTHEAAAGYRPRPDAIWAAGVIPMGDGQIMRHADISAGNIIWNFGEATALIDWEFAMPGERIDDVALAAWLLCPMVPLDDQIEAGYPTGAPIRKRLDSLARGYGEFSVHEIVEAYRALLETEYSRRRKLGMAGVEPWTGYMKAGQLERIQETIAWFEKKGRTRALPR